MALLAGLINRKCIRALKKTMLCRWSILCCDGVIYIKSSARGRCGSILKDIVATSSEFCSCSFIFKGRETNLEAHSLAKHTLGLSLGRHVWLLNPPDLHDIPMNFYNQ